MPSQRLGLATLRSLPPVVQTPGYDPAALSIGVVHFGPGAFHRAHQAAYLDRLAHGDPRFGICAVSLHSSGARDALAPQDGLYTLALLGPVVQHRVIGSLREVLVAPEQPAAVFERLLRPEVRVVTTTVTEKGYCLDGGGKLDLSHPDVAHDAAHPQRPRGLLGYLVEGLRLRHAAGLRPFVLIPCDNLPANGQRLKAAVCALAARHSVALATWIEDRLQCPNTMVDAITPATDDSLRALVAAATGLHDAWPVQREAFAQWVIEAYEDDGGPDWARAGAVVTPDVAAYERAKLWLLNGSHSALAYLGLLKGHATVAQAIADVELDAFVHAYMHDDILPLLAPSPLDLPAYARTIRERFRNPAIVHRLAQIAHDGSLKLPVRIAAPLREALARGADVSRFALPLAAWLRFLRARALDGGEIVDPASAALRQRARELHDEPADVDAWLALPALLALLPADLAHDPTLRQALRLAYSALLQRG